MVVAGDASDFSPGVLDGIAAKFATTANVPRSQVEATVVPASAKLTVKVTASDANAATMIGTQLGATLHSASAASEYLGGGISVVSEPDVLTRTEAEVVAIAPPPPPAPPPAPGSPPQPPPAPLTPGWAVAGDGLRRFPPRQSAVVTESAAAAGPSDCSATNAGPACVVLPRQVFHTLQPMDNKRAPTAPDCTARADGSTPAGCVELPYVNREYAQRDQLHTVPIFERVAAVTPSNDMQMMDVQVGDMNGDGTLDYVTARRFQCNGLILNSQGGRVLTAVSPASFEACSKNTYKIALGDVNGDGR